MRREGTKNIKAMGFQHMEVEIPPAVEIVAAEPDYLRDTTYAALLSLSPDQRASICNRLLTELRKAGFRVRESLLKLGASAKTADELTAPEIASLIRYVRLTEPNVLMSVAEPLSELLALSSRGIRASGKAA